LFNNEKLISPHSVNLIFPEQEVEFFILMSWKVDIERLSIVSSSQNNLAKNISHFFSAEELSAM
jgi:hypothetical protein